MEYTLFKNISPANVGQKLDLRGKIITVKQTSGPTLMVLNDGTQNFTFKAFIKPGVRAFPECDLEDYVRVGAVINERQGNIEGEVKFMKKMDSSDKNDFEATIQKLNDTKTMPATTKFTIESKGLESLKDRFIQVTKIIKQAILENRPILVRHNADTDGYSSAITIERAIFKFMDEVSGGDKMLKYMNYKRAPSKAPFYEYEDSVKDLAYYLRDKVKNGQKAPLVIITDNGSTQEDILSIKQMKTYGCPIVVVDHHYPGDRKEISKLNEDEIKQYPSLVERDLKNLSESDCVVEVDKYIDAHINGYLTGYDSNICAGMLGYELANFIYEDNGNSVFIPAMAAILDHCDCTERVQYTAQAKKAGFSEEYLANLGEIVDMQSHYLRFMEAREFVDDLFGNNMEAQKAMVEMLVPELKQRYDMVEKVATEFAEIKDYGNFYLISFDGEKGTFRGDYPQIGKSTNHIHKTFEAKQDKPIVTMTHGSTFMTLRVSDKIKNFEVPTFVQMVFKELPNLNANGGGHEHAGSVRFIEYGREKVLLLFDKYLKEVNSKQ